MRFVLATMTLAGGIVLAASTGCGRNEETAEGEPKEEEKSSVEQTVEDMTGVTTIREGEKVKDKIRGIQEDRLRQYEDAMGNE